MECSFEINVAEPKEGDMMFHPYVQFRLVQLNTTPRCVTDGEIDYQIKQLVENAQKLGKKAKKKLKDAMARHDALLEKKRANRS